MQSGANGSTVLKLGKHSGKTFEELLRSEPGYCRWVLGLESASNQLQELKTYLQKNAKDGKLGTQMTTQARDVFRSEQIGSSGEPRNAAIICELAADHTFVVRGASKTKDATLRSSAFSAAAELAVQNSGGDFRGDTYSAIAALPHVRPLAGRSGFQFPLNKYEETIQRLQKITSVEPIPSWALQVVRKTSFVSKSSTTPNSANIGTELQQERLPAGLLPYQLDGVRFGVSKAGRCLIGDEMGLGKTLQALAIVAQYAEDWPVLVICPSSLRWVWKEQITQWMGGMVEPDEVQVVRSGSEKLDPGAMFTIISYTLLAMDAKKEGKFQQRLNGTRHEVVIVDESHNIKDWSAERTKVVVGLAGKATRTVLLSGTPTRNSPEEIHPQLCALLRTTCTLKEFRSRYCVMQEQRVPNGRTVQRVVGSRNTTELNTLLTSAVMVRRLKKEVMTQLPEKRRQKVPLEVADQKLLKDIRRQLVDGGGEELSSNGEKAPSIFCEVAKAKLNAVKAYVEELLDRSSEKVIIFAHHKLMIDALEEVIAKKLKGDKLSFIRIDGKTAMQKRPDLVNKFQKEETCQVALLSITACNEGLTLTAAGLVVFAELYWVPGAIEQAEARAHRIGTTHSKVVVEFLVAPGTPDEHIYARLERKKRDTSRVIDGKEETLKAQTRALHVVREKPKKRLPGASAPVGAADEGASPSDATTAKRAKTSAAAAATSPPPASAGDDGSAPKRAKTSLAASASSPPATSQAAAAAKATPEKTAPLTTPPEATKIESVSAQMKAKIEYLRSAARDGKASLPVTKKKILEEAKAAAATEAAKAAAKAAAPPAGPQASAAAAAASEAASA
eukprot:TRINITY_DN12693_c0_g4_i1.p1 TRINITY_DN12693_c0_g4~~TRINITY_DN12693_c0_g4_i1.p1  ORF type:complete len:843 (-),score=268.70 TRINITY_DN12693_c0_g4_i1:248-2776(-)